MTSHSQQSAYCWGFVMFLHYNNSLNNSGSQNTGATVQHEHNQQRHPAPFTADPATWMTPPGKEGAPFCVLENTGHCPSGLLNMRCFQWFEFSLFSSSIFLLNSLIR